MWSALPAVDINDLIVPGPVERGLYVARGSGLAPVVAQKLVELLGAEHDAEQFKTAPKLTYSPARYWRRNSRIGQLIWVDSGNVFDPYSITVEARKRRLDPSRVLRAIKVGRPFTAFQFQQMLERVPNPALWAPNTHYGDLSIPPERMRGEGLANSQAVWWTPLIVVSDLMGLFYDPDLPDDALARAFRSFLVRLSFLRQRAIVLALLPDYHAPTGREGLLSEVLKMARRVYMQDPELTQASPLKLVANLG